MLGAARATGAEFVVEVADTSLRFDTTTKQALYAREGVLDDWVVVGSGGVGSVMVVKAQRDWIETPAGRI